MRWSRVLAANRLGEGIVGGHAGITAEGDNRVLMQKIAKELLGRADKSKLAKQKALTLLPSFLKRMVQEYRYWQSFKSNFCFKYFKGKRKPFAF